MKGNPLLKLGDFGQSIWLDYLRRALYTSGELQQMIKEDGLRGMTSNPAIFEKAIAGSQDYDDAVRALALEGKGVEAIYEALVVEDVRRAADVFRPTYDGSEGRDGFVSLEVSPRLAHDAEGTIAEAERLWSAVDRPNLMIKVPATTAGLLAIKELVGKGINVNVTLLFGLPRYRQVAEAYISGLEALLAQGRPMDRVASVASFFLSRIDVLVDPMLDNWMKESGPKAKMARDLHGQLAVASAKVAYQMYREIFMGKRFQNLVAQGARTQRLLWASTSTKNPAYSDVKYVESLIGPETVNTMPLETLHAYRDHGDPSARLEVGVDQARHVLRRLSEVGIDLDALTQKLEDEGVAKFVKPFDQLMDTLAQERGLALEEPVDRQSLDLGTYGSHVHRRLASLGQKQFSARFWRKDSSLWKSDPESQTVIANALGWLHVAEKMEEQVEGLSDFVSEIRDANIRHVVLMGMGGSSLAPLVFQRTFAPAEDYPSLTDLDTTDPATVLRIEREAPLVQTLFVVASKSGTTVEPLAFEDHFYVQVQALKGERAGESFVSITDPGTPLEKLSYERGFRRVFLNFADVGGRYSALSYFGLLPAALMGVDVAELLLRALRMMHACASCVPVAENPGVALGAAMGELALRGRNKVTFLMPARVSTLGMWLEQLLAESTGKEGTGLLPVAGEPLGAPSVYGDDRLFVHIRLRDEVDAVLERGVAALQKAGHPVVTVQMDDLLDLGQEFFRWEVATATAGAILGINAFDQPNVQESKDNTDRLLSVLRKEGQLPEEKPALVEEPLSLYIEDIGPTVAGTLSQFFGQARPGDYVSLMAYLTEGPETQRALQAIRVRLRDALRLATTVGYGPRFLHSTGQFHKGGPNTGLFLQLTADDAKDADVPGQPYTFSVLRRAQALGDLEALRKHGRRVLRIHLGSDAIEGLAALENALPTAG